MLDPMVIIWYYMSSMRSDVVYVYLLAPWVRLAQ